MELPAREAPTIMLVNALPILTYASGIFGMGDGSTTSSALQVSARLCYILKTAQKYQGNPREPTGTGGHDIDGNHEVQERHREK